MRKTLSAALALILLQTGLLPAWAQVRTLGAPESPAPGSQAAPLSAPALDAAPLAAAPSLEAGDALSNDSLSTLPTRDEMAPEAARSLSAAPLARRTGEKNGEDVPASTDRTLRAAASGRVDGSRTFDGSGSGFNILHPEDGLPREVDAALKAAGLTPLRTRKSKLKLPSGVKEFKPGESGPVRAASVDRFHFAANHAAEDGSKPVALDIDLTGVRLDEEASRAQAMAQVEAALRKLVDADPASYGASAKNGAPSKDMWTVHVAYAPAVVGDPSIYAVFRQWKTGTQKDGSPYRVAVQGGQMRFHLKVFNGKPFVMAYSGGFADVPSEVLAARFTDDEAAKIAASQLSGPSETGPPAQKRRSKASKAADAPNFLGRQLMPLGQDPSSSQWRVVDFFQGADLKGNPALVIVDVKTGEAFVVNPENMRMRVPGRQAVASKPGPAPAAPKERVRIDIQTFDGMTSADAITGKVEGRGNTLVDGQDHDPIGPMPLSRAYIYDDATGQIAATTAEDGTFSISADVHQGMPMRLRVGTVGVYAPVHDADEKDPDLTVTRPVRPGEKVSFLLNPTGEDEQLAAVVNAYVDVYGLVDWVKAGLAKLGLSDPRIDKALVGIIANGTAMVGNAFFDPSTRTLNLMRRGTMRQRARGRDGKIHTVTITAENTAQPSIDKHEDTHSLVGITGQGALTEEQAASPEFQYVRYLLDPVMGADINEATADMGSMFNRGNPELGNGFLISIVTDDGRKLPLPKPNNIRNGTNKIPYAEFNPNDPSSDPHNSGNTAMGTAWMSYADLIPRLGAEKAALAAFRHFFLTSLYIQPANAATALSHMIVDGLRHDGGNPLAEPIRSHAKDDHGLELPDAPKAPSA